MNHERTSRWIGFDPVRLAALARRTAVATDHLDSIHSDDPAAAPALAVVSGIRHELTTCWMPALVRAAADESLSGWTSSGPADVPLSDRVAFLLGTALGRMYGDVIEVAVDGDLDQLDGYTSPADTAVASAEPERIRRLVEEWGRRHGVVFDAATVEFLTGEIVATAVAMEESGGEPWNEMHGSMAATARDGMFAVVVARQPVVGLDLVAAAGDAELAGRWWATLTGAERAELVAARPEVVGGTAGLPAATRDLANRAVLAADLGSADLDVRRNAEHVDAYLHEAARHVDPRTGEHLVVQLYVYEPAAFGGEGRVAVALGDVDTADHVAVAVPGLGSSVGNMAPAEPLRIYDESRWATGDGNSSVAVVDWMGYDAPSFGFTESELADGEFDALVDALGDAAGVVGQGAARDGARMLAADVDGIVALRADGAGPAHVTVIGHSYGSTTVATAAADFGLGADDVVLTGSPGAGSAGSAADLVTGTEHTWVASPSTDPVTLLGHSDGGVRVVGALGNDPAMDVFGAQRIRSENAGRGSPLDPTDWMAEHDGQFLAGSESLYNVAAIVAGDYDAVALAGPRTQQPLIEWGWPPDVNPWPYDPEATRPVTTPSHAAP